MELHADPSNTTFVPAALVLTAVTLLAIYRNRKRRQNLPPGPPSYPIVGNIPDLVSGNLLETFRKFRKSYGDLYSVRLGTHLTIVVNGYENLKELFSKKGDSVSDRPPTFVFTEIAKQRGLASSSGNLWKIHRTFALKTLRGFGVGKKSIQSNIKEEVDVLLQEIEKHDGKPFDMDVLINTCVSNIICYIVFGQRFEHTDKKFKTMIQLFRENLEISNLAGPITVFPSLKYIPGDLFHGKRLLRNAHAIEEFTQTFIDEHKKTFDPDNVRDYIDSYLKEKQQKSETETETFTDEQLQGSIIDLFIAGTETTATSLKWLVLYLLNNPTVQTKMAEEIESVVGTSRLSSLEDKPSLPYCEAVITEVMRCGNIAPLSIMHSASQDVSMNGFTIPKGSILIPNLDSVMSDPEHFQNPEEFRPERFIDDSGKFSGYDKVIPFSIGRRVCLGESLARAELFLFSTSLVQRFNMQPKEGESPPPVTGHMGIVHTPHSYKFRALKRQ